MIAQVLKDYGITTKEFSMVVTDYDLKAKVSSSSRAKYMSVQWATCISGKLIKLFVLYIHVHNIINNK